MSFNLIKAFFSIKSLKYYVILMHWQNLIPPPQGLNLSINKLKVTSFYRNFMVNSFKCIYQNICFLLTQTPFSSDIRTHKWKKVVFVNHNIFFTKAKSYPPVWILSVTVNMSNFFKRIRNCLCEKKSKQYILKCVFKKVFIVLLVYAFIINQCIISMYNLLLKFAETQILLGTF